MAVKFTNNAKTTLASGITSSATSATVTDGSVFPSLSSGEHFYCTFDDGTNNEIVKVTARSSNTLTIVRAADNTTARAFSSGDQAELRATAALLTDIQENIAAKSANQTVYNTTTASSATSYNVGTDPGVEGNAMVFLNGVLQHHDTISFSGSTLTFDAAPPNGMALEVIIDNLINLQSSNLTVDTFTAADVSGSPQTDFTLSDTPAAEQNLIVFVDGVFQAQDAYTISNEVLTMTDGVTAGLDVTVYVINPVNIGTPSDSTVTSAKLSGNITTPGALTVSGAFTSQGIDDNADATAITISSDENVAVTGDLSARKITSNNGVLELDDNGTHNGIINVPASISINIDSDNNNTTESFTISKNKTAINDTDCLFRVIESGNVSIGTTSANNFKTYVESSTMGLFVNAGDGGYTALGFSGDGTTTEASFTTHNGLIYIGSENSNGTGSNGEFRIQPSTSERMRINSGGELCINNTYSGSKLHVLNSGSDTSNWCARFYTTHTSNPNYIVDFIDYQGQRMGEIRGNPSANTISYLTSSDYRLKENVTYDWDATTRLNQLKPARFNWIRDESNTLVDGFLAHEVENIVPEATMGEKDATETKTNAVLNEFGNWIATDITEEEWEEGKEDGTYATDTTWAASHTQNLYQSIDQAKLIPLLVKALQESNTKIEALETRIETLENG